MAEGEEPLTPEKQLLKLIENPKKESVQAASVQRGARQWFSLGALRGRLAFLQSISFPNFLHLDRRNFRSFGVKELNLALKVAIFFLVLYFGYSLVAMALQLKRASNFIFKPELSLLPPDESATAVKSLPYYLEKVSARNIFTPATPPAAEEVHVTQEFVSVSEGGEDPTKNLSLVGIAWSENPEAMIEDKALTRTHFLTRGQSIDNKTKVIAIFKDRVILQYKNREIELK